MGNSKSSFTLPTAEDIKIVAEKYELKEKTDKKKNEENHKNQEKYTIEKLLKLINKELRKGVLKGRVRLFFNVNDNYKTNVINGIKKELIEKHFIVKSLEFDSWTWIEGQFIGETWTDLYYNVVIP